MDRYTVMLVPAGAGVVRRFEIASIWLRRLTVGALIAASAIAAIAADWAHLRREGAELARLRAETATQHEQLQSYDEQLQGYAEKVRDVEAQLATLREFERKVRIIANLPAATGGAPGEAARPGLGVGGGADDPALATPPIGAPTGTNLRRPQALAPGGEARDPESTAPPVSSNAPLGRAEWVRLQARAAWILGRAQLQEKSLENLLEAIRGKADRLASTPSIWPAHGWLTSRFGYRISPFTGLRELHAGLDISAEPGTEIVAPARGRVVFAGTQGAFGNVVILDHGFGIRTLFGHAREIRVKQGQTVERGQVIASVGSSGRSTGPHLHYGVERDGRLTNPIDYIVE